MLLLAVLIAGLAVLFSYYGLTPGGGQGVDTAQASDPEMTLGATGNVACDDPPTTCTAEFNPPDPKAAEFTLTVNASVIPEDGYSGFGSEVFFGGLTYNQRAACTDELVWPDEALCVQSVGAGGQRQLGSGTGVTAPFPKSNFAGALVELDVHCPAAGQFTVSLTAAPSSAFGASYIDLDGAAVFLKTVGSQQLDLNGDTTPETVDVADTLEIDCSGPGGGPPLGPPTDGVVRPTATLAPAIATPEPTLTATSTEPTPISLAPAIDCPDRGHYHLNIEKLQAQPAMADAVITEIDEGEIRVEFQGAVFFVNGWWKNIIVRPARDVSDALLSQLIGAIDAVAFEC